MKRTVSKTPQYGIISILEDAELRLGYIPEKNTPKSEYIQDKINVEAANDLEPKNAMVLPNRAVLLNEIQQAKKEWKDTPLDMDFKRCDNSILCAMKRIGIDHIRNNIPCQDSYKIEICPKSGCRILSVADGHSDKRHDLSEYGSALACESVCEIVSTVAESMKQDDVIKYFKDIRFKYDIIKKWQNKVLEHYHTNINGQDESERNVFLRYGTTLLFAVSYKDKIVTGKLGDGGILLSADDKYFQLLFKETKIGSATLSMCMKDAYMFLNVKIFNKCDFNRVMLMTDGIFDLFESQKYLEDNMNAFVNILEDDDVRICSAFTEKFNEFVDYNQDDTTVGLMTLDSCMSQTIPKILRGNSREYIVDSYEYRERTIKAYCHSNKERYTAILSKYIEPEIPKVGNLENFIEVFTINEYTCCIYRYESGYSITGIFDKNIIDRNKKIPDTELMKIIQWIITDGSKLKTDSLNDTELFYEMTEILGENDKIVVLPYCERSHNQRRISVLMQLLMDLLVGWRCCIDNIVYDETGLYVVFSNKEDIILNNLERIHSYYIKAVLKGEEKHVCSILKHILTVKCKQCKKEIMTYKSITICPHCRQPIAAKAEYHVNDSDIYGFLCTNTMLSGINFGTGTDEYIIETMYQPSSGALGIKSLTDNKIKVNNRSIDKVPVKLNEGDVISNENIRVTILKLQ